MLRTVPEFAPGHRPLRLSTWDMNPGTSDSEIRFLISVGYNANHVGWDKESGKIQVTHCKPLYMVDGSWTFNQIFPVHLKCTQPNANTGLPGGGACPPGPAHSLLFAQSQPCLFGLHPPQGFGCRFSFPPSRCSLLP